MKKTKFVLMILVIAVVTILATSLTACTTASAQGLLGNFFNDYEEYTYLVEDKTDKDNIQKGSYKVTLEKVAKDENVSLSSNLTFTKVDAGTLATSIFDLNGTTIETKSFYQTSGSTGFMSPMGSVKITTSNGTTKTVTQKYNGATVEFSIEETGKEKVTGSITNSTPCFDNTQIYTLARSSSSFANGSFNIAFSTAIPEEKTSAKLSIAIAGQATSMAPENVELDSKLKAIFDVDANEDGKADGIPSFITTFSRSTAVNGGISYYMNYAKSPIKINNVSLKNVLLSFVENNLSYTLYKINVIK